MSAELHPDAYQFPCRKCGEVKPWMDEFWYRHTDRLHYHYACKICHDKEFQERYQRNKAEFQQRSRERNKINYDHKYEMDKRWREQNRDKVRAAHKRRRDRKRDLPNNFTESDWQRALHYFHGRCAICGRSEGLSHKIAQDHWISLSDSRTNNPGTVPLNIVPVCHSRHNGGEGCNNLKANKPVEQWLIDRFGMHEAEKILFRVHGYFMWIKLQLLPVQQLAFDF